MITLTMTFDNPKYTYITFYIKFLLISRLNIWHNFERFGI